MHIAILDEELPFPLTSGKRIRTMNLLERLATRHRLTYICHRNADADEAVAAEKHFADLGIHTVVVDRAVPPKSGPRFYARLAQNLRSPLPYSVASHTSLELSEAVRVFAMRHKIQLWHCEWTPYAETIKTLPKAPWVVMAHNVESLIWQRYAETETNPVKRWYIRKQWNKFETFERWAYTAATRAIAVSSTDAELMRERFGAQRVEVVDNGVDTSYFRPTEKPREPHTILFLGSLDWRPNQDGVRLMLDSIFPEVRAKEPAAKLLLVGRNPTDWMAERAKSCPGVELHGSVPDVRPFMARAAVLSVPLRIGGGSRLKILEAMAAGLPVVSTRIGAEGLNLTAEQHLDMVESCEEMSGALLTAMREPARMRTMAEEARHLVEAEYDWNSLANRLEEVWLDAAGPLAVKRTAVKQAA